MEPGKLNKHQCVMILRLKKQMKFDTVDSIYSCRSVLAIAYQCNSQRYKPPYIIFSNVRTFARQRLWSSHAFKFLSNFAGDLQRIPVAGCYENGDLGKNLFQLEFHLYVPQTNLYTFVNFATVEV